MNWDDTRIFLSVARSGQILAAARRLGLNHATVARRITALETALNTRLFDRSTSGCFLTDAGSRFLESAERMEVEMMSVRADLGGDSLEVTGTVRIGAPDGFGVAYLAPRLAALPRLHPRLTIQLVPVPRSFSLSRREADIAITIERPDHGRLIAAKLVDYSLGLFASRDYVDRHGLPKSVEELQDHDLIGYVEDLVYSPALNYAAEITREWPSRFEVVSALGQTEAVRAGAGIGILHSFITRQDPVFVPVLPDIRINRAYWTVQHESTRPLRHVATALEFLRGMVQRDRAIFV